MTKRSFKLLLGSLVFSLTTVLAHAQSTEFTYQGRLLSGAVPADGSHDFEFSLWDGDSGSNQIGTTITLTQVNVNNGVFSVRLDFGNVFPGANRFLEIKVRQSGAAAFTTLSPRQAITSAPYSIKSLTAETAATANTAANANQLGGLDPNQFVITTDTRLDDARTPLPNSPNYIQNSTAMQSNSNFNIGGTGTAARFNSSAGYSINGVQVLRADAINNLLSVGRNAGVSNTTGTDNTFLGNNSGQANQQGSFNTFIGKATGQANISGRSNTFVGDSAGFANNAERNSFFGSAAGFSNITGANNSFFGDSSGTANTDGSGNSFFGAQSGFSNTTGQGNSFFGGNAGRSNSSGVGNSFFGGGAGMGNTSGGGNAFIGIASGNLNTSGINNTFVGSFGGSSNTTGSYNTLLGSSANVGSANLVNATAIGAFAIVSSSNTIVLGRSNGSDTVQVPGSLSVNTNVGIGTASPLAALHVRANNGNVLIGHQFCNSGFVGIGFGAGAGCNNYSLLGNGTDTFINRATGGTLFFREGNTTQMLISPGGAVTVAGNLTVNGTLNAPLPANSSNYIWNSATPQATSNFSISGNGTVGGTLTGAVVNATTQYNLNGARVLKSNVNNLTVGANTGDTGDANTFVGRDTGLNNASGGNANAFFGDSAGQSNTTGDNNAFLGEGAGFTNTTGNDNTAVGSRADVASGNLNFATAIGAGAIVSTSNTIMLGRFEDKVIAAGRMRASSIPLEPSAASVCFNAAGDLLRCGASSLRFKRNVQPFMGGLDVIRRLRPISFKWKDDGTPDIGLAAEEVAKVEPFLSIRNDRGEVGGVKYDRIGVLLVNAVKQQQSEIESQKLSIKLQQEQIQEQTQKIKRQQEEIDELKKFMCSQTPAAQFCRVKN